MSPLPFSTYEHSEGAYVDELVKVPRFVTVVEDGKSIVEAY